MAQSSSTRVAGGGSAINISKSAVSSLVRNTSVDVETWGYFCGSAKGSESYFDTYVEQAQTENCTDCVSAGNQSIIDQLSAIKRDDHDAVIQIHSHLHDRHILYYDYSSKGMGLSAQDKSVAKWLFSEMSALEFQKALVGVFTIARSGERVSKGLLQIYDPPFTNSKEADNVQLHGDA